MRLFSILALLVLGAMPLAAQTGTPAQPADPSQARPAQAVEPATPAVPPSGATNAVTPDAPAPSADVAVTVIADASLKQVIQELAQAWADTQETGPQVPLTLTNAGTLRSKIETGSVWDVVISSDVDDMKALTTKGLLLADGQRSLARNALVLYGKKPLVKDDDLEWFDLVGTEWNKVAIANPDLSISGRVAKRALEKHGLLDEDHKQIFSYAPTDPLAQAMVQRDQASAVFVCRTDLPKLNIPGFTVYPLSSGDAPPFFYIAAVGKLAKDPVKARAFIDYCGSEAAKPIWAKYGFETN